jgi:hypothetical protein
MRKVAKLEQRLGQASSEVPKETKSSSMNSRALLRRFAVITIIAAPLGCSKRPEPVTTATPVGEVLPATPPATPDPAAPRRAELLARIAKLDEPNCDELMLEFQLVPRDEVLEPLSEPRKELVRFVKRFASPEQLDDLDRAITRNLKRSREEWDAIKRAKQDRAK